MDPLVLVVFAVVYLAMALGRLPGLALDRTGVALLGAIVLIAGGRMDMASARSSVDTATVGLLLGLMVVSAQFRLAGSYSHLVRRMAVLKVSPSALLGLLVGVTALLSAVLANDIVCLAVAPILVEGCSRRGLDSVPFLLALACASNVGSAATLIGNPQNMLIGQVLNMSFSSYLLLAAVPVALGLAAVWLIIWLFYRRRWEAPAASFTVQAPPFSRWQTGKGLAVTLALMAVFLFTDWPREVAALAAAGLLLCSRRVKSREVLGLVDWQLIVLFASLFILNRAVADSGYLEAGMSVVASAGVRVSELPNLFLLSAILSNVVSNVPAVMLLLPSTADPLAGAVLALSSTLAGNLFIVGSIANIIVVSQAARFGVRITWRDHARVGVPVTLITLAITAGFLALAAG